MILPLPTIVPQKLTMAGAYRYKNARRPGLYGTIISAPHTGVQQVAWMKKGESSMFNFSYAVFRDLISDQPAVAERLLPGCFL